MEKTEFGRRIGDGGDEGLVCWRGRKDELYGDRSDSSMWEFVRNG